jgi:hypothetical protein
MKISELLERPLDMNALKKVIPSPAKLAKLQEHISAAQSGDALAEAQEKWIETSVERRLLQAILKNREQFNLLTATSPDRLWLHPQTRPTLDFLHREDTEGHADYGLVLYSTHQTIAETGLIRPYIDELIDQDRKAAITLAEKAIKHRESTCPTLVEYMSTYIFRRLDKKLRWNFDVPESTGT